MCVAVPISVIVFLGHPAIMCLCVSSFSFAHDSVSYVVISIDIMLTHSRVMLLS